MANPNDIFDYVCKIIDAALDQNLPPTAESYLLQRMRIESAIGKALSSPDCVVLIDGKAAPIADFTVNSRFDYKANRWASDVNITTVACVDKFVVNFETKYTEKDMGSND